MTAADSPTPPPQQPAGTNWTVGRILLVILGCIVALLAAGLLAAGGTLLWADLTQRDDDGFLTTPTELFTSDSFAITSDSIDLFEADTHGDWVLSEGVLGEVRITGENAQGGMSSSASPTRTTSMPISTALRTTRYATSTSTRSRWTTGASRAASRPGHRPTRASGPPRPPAPERRTQPGRPSPATGRSWS